MKIDTYTGKPCKRGGHTERYKSQGNCVLCARLDRANFYEKNRGAVCAESMRYHAINRDAILERQKRYHALYKDVLSAKALSYRKLNRAAAARNSREWREANPGRNEQAVKQWLRKNPMKAREYSNARRTRKIGAAGRYTPNDVAALMLRQSGRCQYCCVILGNDLHVDHIVALVNGGTNYPSNICLACPTCNRMKHTSSAEEFAGRLLS